MRVKNHSESGRFWAVVKPDHSIYWLGVADDQPHAWFIALGWPSPKEIADCQSEGWYAAPISVYWTTTHERSEGESPAALPAPLRS